MEYLNRVDRGMELSLPWIIIFTLEVFLLAYVGALRKLKVARMEGRVEVTQQRCINLA